MMAPDNEKPAGHPKYWPIYEAAEHYGIPVAFHVLAGRTITGTGIPNYYFEEHTQFAAYNFPLVASLIFEGVFKRFPKLRIGLIELAWPWVVPFAWRMDHAYALMRDEVSHLPRSPSEYLAEHFWFSSQPMEEPERLDFDEPTNLPVTLPLETRRKILGETASHLYNIPLRASSGTIGLAED